MIDVCEYFEVREHVCLDTGHYILMYHGDSSCSIEDVKKQCNTAAHPHKLTATHTATHTVSHDNTAVPDAATRQCHTLPQATLPHTHCHKPHCHTHRPTHCQTLSHSPPHALSDTVTLIAPRTVRHYHNHTRPYCHTVKLTHRHTSHCRRVLVVSHNELQSQP